MSAHFLAFSLAATFCGINVAAYMWAGQPVSIAGAIFCGFFAIYNLMMLATR